MAGPYPGDSLDHITPARPPRRTTRRLVVAFIRQDPLPAVLVLLVSFIALGTGIVTHQVERNAAATLEQEIERGYGALVITRNPASDRLPGVDLPATAEADGRLAPRVVSVIERTVRATGASAYRRVETAAVLESADQWSIVDLIAIGKDDPARERFALTTGAEEGAAFTARVVVRSNDTLTRVTVPPWAVVGLDRHALWVERTWIAGILGVDDAVADMIVVPGPIEASRAFSDAYDVAERVAADLGTPDTVRVRAWPQLVGYQRYLGAGGGSRLVRPLALLVAFIGVAGITVVAVRHRAHDIVTLRTMGSGVGLIRAVVMREIGSASTLAVLVAIAGVLALGALDVRIAGQPVTLDGTVRSLAVAIALVPPILAYLVARRELRRPLRETRRGFGE